MRGHKPMGPRAIWLTWHDQELVRQDKPADNFPVVTTHKVACGVRAKASSHDQITPCLPSI